MSAVIFPSGSSLMIIALCIVLPPLIGGLIAGGSRYIAAKKQGQKAPSLLQVFYDSFVAVGRSPAVCPDGRAALCVSLSILFHLLALVMLGLQMNLVPILFFQAFGVLVPIIGKISGPDPFHESSAYTALKELLSVQPVLFFAVAGIFFATGSFNVATAQEYPRLLAVDLPLIFVALLYAEHTLRNADKVNRGKDPLAAVMKISDCYRSGILLLLAGNFLSHGLFKTVVASILLGIFSAWYPEVRALISGELKRKWGWSFVYFACVLNITWIYIKFWM